MYGNKIYCTPKGHVYKGSKTEHLEWIISHVRIFHSKKTEIPFQSSQQQIKIIRNKNKMKQTTKRLLNYTK